MFAIRYFKYLLVSCSAVALIATNAVAQQAPGDVDPVINTSNDDEIIVTARRRAESQQDAPVTVTAITATEIERLGISGVDDYASLVPNFFLVETQNSTFSFPNIRGISQSRNIDQSVAVVIDGVLSTSPTAFSQELFDVQQIEVYKGPQGALYGRNAIGGAINITTKKPSNEFEGHFRGSYGNGNSGKAQAVVSGPLIEDTLFGRASFSFRDSDGVRDNVTLDVPSDGAKNVSARGRLIWEPTESFSADLRGSFSDDETTAIGFIDLSPLFTEPFPGAGINFGTALGIPGFTPGAPNSFAGGTITNDGSGAADFIIPGQLLGIGDADNIDSFDVQTNLLGIDERELFNVSLKLDYSTDYFDVTSVTAYDDSRNLTRGEQPPRTSTAFQVNSQFRTSEAFSQEIRFTSPDEQRFRWIAGGYLALTDTFLSTTVQLDSTGTDNLASFITDDPFAQNICTPFPGVTPDGTAFAPFPFSPAGIDTSAGDCVTGFNADEGDNTAFAFFGQLAYDLTDTIELSFSARYDEDRRTNTFVAPTSLVSPAVLALTPEGFGDGFETDAVFNSFQPLATIRWTPSSEFTAYATYSEGFRSGGFNAGGFAELADAAIAAGTPGVPTGIEPVFDQQDTRGGEIGIKTSWLGGALTANAAGFYTEVDNYQTFNFAIIGGIGQQFVTPIDEVEIYGFEVDAVWKATDWLKFNGAFALNETEVTADEGNRLIDIVGNQAPLTPDSTLNLGVEVLKDFSYFGQDIESYLKINYQRIGSLFFIAENFAERDPLGLIDLTIGGDIGEHWSLVGRVDNLSNENFCSELFNPGGFCFPGALRKWEIEATYRF